MYSWQDARSTGFTEEEKSAFHPAQYIYHGLYGDSFGFH